ncbi:hypothetical protein QUF58_07830 [Anaerolineales bacterium HSG24]|nr:hypothetical protein [Anaerolineales bacterium HSG24]
MNRDDFAEKVSQWLDDELPHSEVAELKTALSQSDEHRQIYQELKEIDSMLTIAGSEMTAPLAGFSERFEARLVQQETDRKEKKWMAVVALFLGATFLSTLVLSVLINGALGIVGSTSALDVGIVSQWQIILITGINYVLTIANLFSVLLKASLITMTQPLFWACALVSAMVTGGWFRLMQLLHRQQPLALPILA